MNKKINQIKRIFSNENIDDYAIIKGVNVDNLKIKKDRINIFYNLDEYNLKNIRMKCLFSNIPYMEFVFDDFINGDFCKIPFIQKNYNIKSLFEEDYISILINVLLTSDICPDKKQFDKLINDKSIHEVKGINLDYSVLEKIMRDIYKDLSLFDCAEFKDSILLDMISNNILISLLGKGVQIKDYDFKNMKKIKIKKNLCSIGDKKYKNIDELMCEYKKLNDRQDVLSFKEMYDFIDNINSKIRAVIDEPYKRNKDNVNNIIKFIHVMAMENNPEIFKKEIFNDFMKLFDSEKMSYKKFFEQRIYFDSLVSSYIEIFDTVDMNIEFELDNHLILNLT